MAKIDSRKTGDMSMVVGWYDQLPFGNFTAPTIVSITTTQARIVFSTESYGSALLGGEFNPTKNTGTIRSLEVPYGGIATEINISLQDFLNPSGWGSAEKSKSFQRKLLAGADTIWGTGGDTSVGENKQYTNSDYIEAY